MFDYETKSLWPVISGESIVGVMKGKRLAEVVSSQKITWKEWNNLHPDTKVLSYDGRQTAGYDNYKDYHSSRAKTGIYTVKQKDNRLKPKTTVIGLEINGKRKVYPVELFKKKGIMSDVFEDLPLLFCHDKTTNNTIVYNRKIEDKILEFKEVKISPFERNNVYAHIAVDTPTGSKWDLNTGKAVDGIFKGKSLEKVDFKKVYWFVWADYYPDSKIYK